MADSKVSDLASATSIGGSDLFYLVQSNTSKKVTASTLYSNAANVSLSGRTTLGGTPQTLGAPGIVNVNAPITHLSADATGGTLNIPQGSDGQIKIVVLTSTAGGSYTFNTSNLAGNANVVFDSVGDSSTLLFTNSFWYVIGGTANVTY